MWLAARGINPFLPPGRERKSSASTLRPIFWSRRANGRPIENLKIEFVEGDAEKLPYEAARFDVVVSMFGAMFAPAARGGCV